MSVECWIKNGACREHPGTYTEYVKDGTLNGRVTYTSVDESYAIAYIDGRWWLQRYADR